MNKQISGNEPLIFMRKGNEGLTLHPDFNQIKIHIVRRKGIGEIVEATTALAKSLDGTLKVIRSDFAVSAGKIEKEKDHYACYFGYRGWKHFRRR